MKTYREGEPFPGRIGRTWDQSEPAFPVPPTAPDGAPNIIYIVLDDVGFGACDTFGGLIETPNITRLADQGLRYVNFHTTALCSPTRACLLTPTSAARETRWWCTGPRVSKRAVRSAASSTT